MPTIEEVAKTALALPEVAETTRYGNRAWSVGGKVFTWERPYSKADLKRFAGSSPPDEPIVALAVDGLDEKEAILSEGAPGVFTIEHFDGYPAILIELDAIRPERLREAIVDAWMSRAAGPLVDAYLQST